MLIAACTLFASCLSGGSKPVEAPIEAPTVEETEYVVLVIERPPYITKEVEGVFFDPEEIKPLPVPGEVGMISERDADAAAASGADIRSLFIDAYRQALIRSMPLQKVLGMDRVHLWPENSGLAWVQNWRLPDAAPGSWGISGLALAVLNEKDGKVFTVSGDILDMYGKSLGIGGANGIVGYGAPLTEVFLMKLPDYPVPVYAQRFDNGLIYIDNRRKPVFIAGKVPSTLINNDDMTGFYPGDDAELREKLKISFEKEYKTLVDRSEGAIKADGPVEYLNFDGNRWPFELEGRVFFISGVYVQYYNKGVFAIILPEFTAEDGGAAEAFPFLKEAHTIAPPFSEVIFGRIRLPSTAELEPLPLKDYASRPPLLKSLALYGIPLTNLFVSETGMYAQRFSRGIFRSNTKQETINGEW